MNKTKLNLKKQTLTWFRVFCLTLIATCLGLQTFSQVNFSQNFNANATGWTGTITRTTATTACGSASMRRNMYSGVTTGTLISPSMGTTTGGQITLSYKYKVADWSANTVGTANPWGSFNVQYGATAAGPWTTVQTINSGNHIVSATCTTAVAIFTPPTGALFIKWDAVWSAGDYYINFDDISAVEALGPCTTPAPGNTLTSGGANACAGVPFTLSLQNATTGAVVSYQWQSADPSDPGFTTPTVLGSAATQVIANQTTAKLYRCRVTCSVGPDVTFSNTLAVGQNTHYACYCVPTYTAAGACIDQVDINTLSYNTAGAGCALPSYTSVPVGTATTTLERTVQYPLTLTSSAGSWAGVWIDYNQSGTFDASEYTNISTVATGAATNVATITIPGNALTGVTGMRIRKSSVDQTSANACGLFAAGEAEDYLVTIDPAPACSTPTPGNTLTTNAGPVCGGVSFTLSLQNYTPGATVTYQWQSDDNALFTSPTNIAGATNSTAFIAGQADPAGTYYRCEVTCSVGPVTTASNPVYIGQTNYLTCYCTPTWQTATYGCTDNDVIAQVEILQGATSLWLNNSGTGCPSGTAGYSDYTGLGSQVTLQAGTTYSCKVFVGQWAENFTAWMDYNDDGFFASTERLGSTTTAATGSGTAGVLGGSATFPITLSCSPPVGPHRLRVRCAYGVANGAAIVPCAETSNYGEVEDYIVTVFAAVGCPQPSNLTATGGPGEGQIAWNIGCEEVAWNLDISAPGGGDPGVGTGSNPGIMPTTTTYTVSGLEPNTQYEAYLQADCDIPNNNGVSTWLGPTLFTTAPTCFEPTSLIVSSVTAYDAQVDWTAPVSGAPASYQYYVTTSATLPTNATPGTAQSAGSAANQTLSLGGALIPNTLYYVYVRSYCGLTPGSNPNYSAWSLGETFTTLNVPCSGAVAGNTAVATPSAVCSGGTSVISLATPNIGTGITYQWYDGTNTAIPGETNSTYNTPALTAAADYYCEVSCSGGPVETSSTVTVALNAPSLCYCIPTNAGSSCIVNVTINGINNTTPGCEGVNNYNQQAATTTLMEGATYPISVTEDGSFSAIESVWIDYDADGLYEASEWTQITTGSTLGVPSTVNITVPFGATYGATGMRIRSRNTGNQNGAGDACLAMGSGETEDYVVTIVASTACTGAVVGNTAIATPSGVCPGGSSTITLGTQNIGAGITYQWFDGTNTAIPGATNQSYSTGALTVASDYYCEVSCSGGPAETSSTVTVAINGFMNCYCQSIPSNTADEEIHGVSLSATLPAVANVSQTSTCATVAPGAGSILNRYSNYTGNAPLQAEVGSLVNFSIDLGSCGTSPFFNGVGIFIDFDHDGTFNQANEKVFVEAATVQTPVGQATRTVTGSFLIDAGAQYGVTGMRVIDAESYAGATLTPCLAYGYGETEDYLIDLIAPPACSGTPTPGNTLATQTTVCPSATTTLSLQNVTTGSGVTYQWHSLSGGPISGATSNTYTTPGLTVGDDYWCVVTCSGNDGTSTAVTITVSPQVGTSLANPIVIGQAPCIGSPYIDARANTTANCYSDNYTANNSSPDIWYQFTLAAATDIQIQHCGSGFDTYISLLDNVGALIADNDDGGVLCAGSSSSLVATLAAGTYYVVSEGFGTNTGTITTQINTIDPCNTTLPVKVFLEGYYVSPLSLTTAMTNEGYTVTAVGPTDVDDITVELHATSGGPADYTAVTRLQTDGTATATFAAAITGNYYVVINHRSHVQLWSKDPVTFPTAVPYDFTTSSLSAAYDGGLNTSMKEVEPGVWAMYCGDIADYNNSGVPTGGLQDGFVDATDYPFFDTDASNNVQTPDAYYGTDLNGDGFVDATDYPLFDANSAANVQIQYP